MQGRFTSDRPISGMVAATAKSTVVPLVDELEYLVKAFFISIGFSEEDAKLKADSKDEWFGIIDGCQFHATITELTNENPSAW